MFSLPLLIFGLIFIIYFCQLSLDLVCPCFFKILSCIIKLFILSLSDFLMKVLRDINTSHRTTFTVSQRVFSVLWFPFHLVLGNFFLFLSWIVSWHTHHSTMSYLIFLSLYLLEVCLLLIFSFTDLWSDQIHLVISIFQILSEFAMLLLLLF